MTWPTGRETASRGRSTSSRRTPGLFSASGGVLHDDYPNTFFGLQESTGRTFSLAADYHVPNGFGAGATYNYERYEGLQQSHEGDSSTAQFNDPLRNWTADSTETVHYFSLYATPPASAATPRCGSRTISATRTAITSIRFPRAARLRRPISCRTCTTSCSSCTSTRVTG